MEKREGSCAVARLMVVIGGTRVIVGVSGSLRSLGALRVGVAEACSNGATLLAVLAWAPAGGEVAYLRAPCPELLEIWEREARDRLAGAFDAVFGGIPPGVTIREMVVRANPGRALVELAGRPDDLLVIGYGGRKWPSCVFHGAVARHCLTHARCPVLAVPPPDLISTLRPWPHRWRPEYLTGQQGGSAPVAAIAERPVSVATQDLVAYHGAPYYQPAPPPRMRGTLRQLKLATIIGVGILLVILTGILLNGGMP